MDITDIDLLITLYNQKSITKSAKELYISQPALTKRINKLEKFFEKKLVIRTPRGITFTSDGEKLVRHCRLLKQNYQVLIDDMNSSTNETQGYLRLGISNIYAHYEFPKVIKDYTLKFPKVTLDIQAGLSSKVFNFLQNDSISIAIIREDYAWDAEKIKLHSEPMCLVYHKDIDFSNLMDLGYIKYGTGPNLQNQIEHWITENISEMPTACITTNGVKTALELVKNGVGWSIVAEMWLENFNGYTCPLHWKNGNDFIRSTWLYAKNDSLQLTPVSSFIDYIKNFYQL